MRTTPDAADGSATTAPPRRDRGTTFVEILVTIVLLGVAGITVLTALSASIRGSDQHKSKVAAIAELEGAGAYLAREAPEADCDHPPNFTTLLADRPGTRNDGIEVSVDNVDCVSGLLVVTLTASNSPTKANASESLDVTVGGISVIRPGSGAGGGSDPGTGPCTWGTVSTNAPATGVSKAGNDLSAPVTIQISYTGDCSGATASALLTQPAPNPKSYPVPMAYQATGIFEGTLPAVSGVNWKKEAVTVTVTTTGPAGTFTTSFTVK